ncbi:MAG: serine/threonine-protein kinase [Desulfatitalea sp.]
MTSEYGRYRIVKELGKGTMGVVYQAHDPQIDRMVALKILRPDRVTSESFVARFLKEARAIGRLSHPNIVTIYDVGEDHGTVYIAMEFLKGEPFNEVVRSGRLTVPQCVDIARQVAQTLDYAHRQGIVHRDIKPSNIILTEDSQVKLTDFGIARIEDTGAGQQTQAGEILGTPVYMSPEQVMGQIVDGRSDLFSVGVILYEMVVGRRPFSGNNIAAIFRAITHDVPEVPSAADPFIPQSLSDLIMKSLAKETGQRFQTGRQMAEALAIVLPDGKIVDKSSTEAPRRSNTQRIVAAIVLFVVIAGGAGGYYFFGRKAPLPDNSADAGSVVAEPTPPGDIQGIAQAQLATLRISSEPAGAMVYVDNGGKGTTPVDVPLPLGKHELRLSMPGFLAWEAQVELDVLGETPLHVTMRSVE